MCDYIKKAKGACKCSDCRMGYDAYIAEQRHPGYYQCVCSLNFETVRDLTRHVQKYHPEKYDVKNSKNPY